MQRLSYDPKHPMYKIFDVEFSIEIFTYENVYGLDPERSELKVEGDKAILTARGLTWAGGSEKCDGGAMLLVEKMDSESPRLRFKVEAAFKEKLRAVKVIIHGLKGEDVTSDHSEKLAFPWGGLTFDYPRWDYEYKLKMPIVFLRDGDSYTYFAAKDEVVSPKRFSFIPRDDEANVVDVELIYEAPAAGASEMIDTAPWEMGTTKDSMAEAVKFLDWVADTYNFTTYETRGDVPEWLRDVSLVLSIHGMHFTGYIFNTYKEMLKVIEWFAKRMEGKRFLAYLPGWEGRYYWQYGDYRPEPRLGGVGDFKKLVEGAKDLGVKLMPMFGANCTNREHPDFPDYGPISLLHDASGTQFLGNRPDWSTDRSYDPGWQIWLNPAAPAWQEKLIESLTNIIDGYGIDAIFLDTHDTWTNDPYYQVYEGWKDIKEELKSNRPDLLIAGELWYDALLGITPLTQWGGPAHWPGIFEKYARSTPHLCYPSPCRGSTGVHEFGYGPFAMPTLMKEQIPMVTIVDGTLAAAPDKLMDYVKLAEEYAGSFLDK